MGSDAEKESQSIFVIPSARFGARNLGSPRDPHHEEICVPSHELPVI
jgi:hypothetical protein